MYFALLTFAFSFVVLGVAQEWQKEYSSVGLLLPIKNEPWNLLFLDQRVYVYILLGMVACALVVWHFVKRGRWGYFLEAAREDESAAKSLGINVPRVFTWTMVLSACATAIGGAVYAAYLGSLDATYMFSADWTISILAATIVGGIGRMWGPVVGAAVVTALNELVQGLPSDVSIAGISTLLYGAVLLGVITLMPGGLTGARRVLSWRPNAARRRRAANA
jgi:branched-chain amino acid transport system permease protein